MYVSPINCKLTFLGPIDFNPAEYFIDLISESTSGGQRIEFNTNMLPPTISVEKLEKDYGVAPTFVKQNDFYYDDTPKQIIVMDRAVVRKIDVERIDYLLKYYDETIFVNYNSPQVWNYFCKLTLIPGQR
jgi:hypothetical protein